MSIQRLDTEDIFVSIGKILRPVGLDGELKVQNLSDIEDRFEQQKELYIGPNAELAMPYEVESVDHRNGAVVLRLRGFDSFEKVEFLRGQFCYLPRIDAEWLDEDEFFVQDLIGLLVYDNRENFVGDVKDVMSANGNDVLVIRRQTREILLPMVDEFIQEINLEDMFIIINPIDGLLEASSAG